LLDKTNPEIFNNISTNVTLNITFFVVFIVFALSFFGLYEIGLPSSFANKVDSKSGIGDFAGIFFMALTLAIVSFSCTGPILGSLLAGALSNNGGAIQLTAGMSGFGLGLALPFALFALFPALASIDSQIRWLAEQCESGTGLSGAGHGRKVSFQCRPGEAMGTFKAGSIYRHLDHHWSGHRFIPAWCDQIFTRQ
jgi:cytochrome c biogenesis protein CcdA